MKLNKENKKTIDYSMYLVEDDLQNEINKHLGELYEKHPYLHSFGIKPIEVGSRKKQNTFLPCNIITIGMIERAEAKKVRTKDNKFKKYTKFK